MIRYLRALLLRYQIWETECWIRACERDGLFDGVSLRYIRADLADMRVRLALLQAPLARATNHREAA